MCLLSPDLAAVRDTIDQIVVETGLRRDVDIESSSFLPARRRSFASKLPHHQVLVFLHMPCHLLFVVRLDRLQRDNSCDALLDLDDIPFRTRFFCGRRDSCPTSSCVVCLNFYPLGKALRAAEGT